MVVEEGRINSDLGLASSCSAQLSGLLVDPQRALIGVDLVAQVERTPLGVAGNASLLAKSLPSMVNPLGRCPAQPCGPPVDLQAVVADVERVEFEPANRLTSSFLIFCR